MTPSSAFSAELRPAYSPANPIVLALLATLAAAVMVLANIVSRLSPRRAGTASGAPKESSVALAPNPTL
jgi:hypothetical protein